MSMTSICRIDRPPRLRMDSKQPPRRKARMKTIPLMGLYGLRRARVRHRCIAMGDHEVGNPGIDVVNTGER